MIKFLDLDAQRARIQKDLDRRFEMVFSHGQFINGPEVAELEKVLADYVGVKHCVSCGNGTDALTISLIALGVGVGDEVITPAFSYIAAAESIAILGAKPVYIDVDSRTFNLDVNLLENLITDKTKAIIPVSLFGQCPDFDEILSVANKYKIPVIEDAAQSFGAKYKGKMSCSLTTLACASFFPSKPLGCYGDGGAIFTNDDNLAKAIRMVARHGQEKRYFHTRLGVNSRLDTLQAAVLLSKMSIFSEEMELRREKAEVYNELFKSANLEGIELPFVSSDRESVYAQYTIKVEGRSILQQKLQALGVPTVVHYPVPLHKQPAVRRSDASCPVSERVCEVVLSLPMHPYLSVEDQSVVVSAVCNSI